MYGYVSFMCVDMLKRFRRFGMLHPLIALIQRTNAPPPFPQPAT